MYVCPNVFGCGARTAGPIWTGEARIDAPQRRNDDGDSRESIGAAWHVPRAGAWTSTKMI